jgi:hypothetical protein
VKRSLRDFLEKELLFEHLRSIYRHFLGTGGYERGEMVQGLVEHLESSEVRSRLVTELTPEEREMLYVLRQVGGIAPRDWLFRELAARGDQPARAMRRVFWNLRRRHVTYLIGSDTAYLPEGISDVLGDRISGMPPRQESDVIPGASAVRQSVHGLVIALFNYIHQSPPRVMAEEERIWKRDLENMADFFHSYLLESGAGGDSVKLIRGRLSRLVELLRKMGFLEKRGKRLYLDAENWSDWSRRSEVDRLSLFLSFLKDHYEKIPLALEALVDWRSAGWIPLDRLTEAVRYRSLRGAFHVLRVRPQAEVAAEGPGRRWVSACVHLLADLGLVYTGSDRDGEPMARATDGAIRAWEMLHSGKSRRRRSKEPEGPRAYAQPNFELLIPEECSPRLHQEIGAVARLRSLDRFWTYVLTPASVARGVEEGFTRDRVLELLDRLVEGMLPSNVRDAVAGWASTTWWVEADGKGTVLRAEESRFDSILRMEGVEEVFERDNHSLFPLVSRKEAAHWLEERGVRVVEEDCDPPGEFGRSAREEYDRALEAWNRRLEHGGEGTPAGSFWDDPVPVEPLPEASS